MTKTSYKMLILICVSLAFFIPSAYGINIAGSSNGAGFSLSMNPEIDDRVSMTASLDRESISSTLEGTGDLKEDHWVANRDGAFASVGVDIENSTGYSYSYSLIPGPRLKKSETVEASESLDVAGADSIRAYAQARNGKGYSVSTDIDISHGSLEGYSNYALASNDEVKISQEFSKAEGDAITSLSTTGTWNKLNPKQPLWIAVRRGIDNPPEGSLNTEAVGSVTGYRVEAAKSEDLSSISQNSHIAGEFSGTATAGSSNVTRTSNYGTVYDLDLKAAIEGGLPGVSGRLGYYVDDDNPSANKIHGAVDAAESGDAINVLPGTYFENVAIEKSLDIFGAGADKTSVDGNNLGSVFKIGETDSSIDVTLSGLTITNGSGTRNIWSILGGGIFNNGRTTIENCLVYGNMLDGSGGGVYNSGTVTITGSTISENSAKIFGAGGGMCNIGTAVISRSNISGNSADGSGGGVINVGTVTITDSIVTRNEAIGYGGGVYNDGLVAIANSIVTDNQAQGFGGGVYNEATITISGSNISGNLAGYNGGGVYSYFGNVAITDSTISRNSAEVGGGVCSGYGDTIMIKDSKISNNSAKWSGGGVRIDDSATITGCTISNNSAMYGGGIYNDGPATITNTTISGNVAYQDGGGVYISWYGTPNILENSTITQNIADYENDGIGIGGGIYSRGTLNFIDANGDGIVDPNTIVFDNYLGNGDESNIEPPLWP